MGLGTKNWNRKVLLRRSILSPKNQIGLPKEMNDYISLESQIFLFSGFYPQKQAQLLWRFYSVLLLMCPVVPPHQGTPSQHYQVGTTPAAQSQINDTMKDGRRGLERGNTREWGQREVRDAWGCSLVKCCMDRGRLERPSRNHPLQSKLTKHAPLPFSFLTSSFWQCPNTCVYQ